jgi:hypothetical protein
VVIGLARDAPGTLRVLSWTDAAISRPKLALRALWGVEALDGGLQDGALHCIACAEQDRPHPNRDAHRRSSGQHGQLSGVASCRCCKPWLPRLAAVQEDHNA